MSELEEECGFNDCGGTCLGNSLCDVCLGKVGKLNARVKELESHIDAYAESNAKLMEEKLKDSAYIAELEAWQKEAVKHLKDISSKENLEWAYLHDFTEFLIKQAEDNGK